ncbi:MAG: hypothetical protein ABI619_00825, partial [Betaproteobacteria bacterium]
TGPTSVHTPEICYSTQNYSIIRQRQAIQIPGEKAELWATTFQSKDIDQSLLRVYYGWTFDGQWAAPKNTRLAHFGLPYLYKIQVAARLPGNKELEDGDVCQRFLKEFLRALRRHQFKGT